MGKRSAWQDRLLATCLPTKPRDKDYLGLGHLHLTLALPEATRCLTSLEASHRMQVRWLNGVSRTRTVVGAAPILVAPRGQRSTEDVIFASTTRDTQNHSSVGTTAALKPQKAVFRVRKIVRGTRLSTILTYCASGRAATVYSAEWTTWYVPLQPTMILLSTDATNP